MNLDLSPQDLAFRDEVRTFLEEALTPELRQAGRRATSVFIDKAFSLAWQKILHQRGWVAPAWPVQYGGPGWNEMQRHIFAAECARAGAPSLSPMGLKMVGPVIMGYGTDEQKAYYLPRLLAGEDYWCQGYSEPGAGSDLAALQLRARLDGDHYVLDGSKIWTTHAHWANRMFCLVRTQTEGKAQAGITFLLLEMNTPGISVKPIITLAGEHEVNQVFFDNVRVPVSNRIGQQDEGWTYAKYLLQFERGNAYAPGLTNMLGKVKKIAGVEPSDGGRRMLDDPDFRRKLAETEIKVETLNATELRMFAARTAGQAMGAASSMLKLEGSQAQQLITELALEAAGVYAQPFVQDTWAEIRGGSNTPRAGADYAATVAPMYFNYRKTSIYAGSNEIQHNIMAKMVLGL